MRAFVTERQVKGRLAVLAVLLASVLSAACLLSWGSSGAYAGDLSGMGSVPSAECDSQAGSGSTTTTSTEVKTVQVNSQIGVPGNEVLKPIPANELQVNSDTGPSLSIRSVRFTGGTMRVTVAHRRGLSSAYSGRLIFKALSRGKSVSVAQRNFALGAGEQQKITVKLSAAARRALLGTKTGSKLLVDYRSPSGIARRVLTASITHLGDSSSVTLER